MIEPSRDGLSVGEARWDAARGERMELGVEESRPLLVQRCYKLAAEEYDALKALDQQIEALKNEP